MAINIINKKDCVGCWACVERCPKQCITMQEDEQGFRYPKVDHNICIECGLCEKVCPVINQKEARRPLATYAAKNCDMAVQISSSSGGVFTALAKQILNKGGVVFGAKFNEDWMVVHDFTETVNGLEAFRRSKYVQSIIGDTFYQCEQFLRQGRTVLFSGTPCQIAGLKLYLHKDYDNLITVDFICHGVPSPLVWMEYLKSILPRPTGAVDGKNTDFQSLNVTPRHVVSGISFRDKRFGWEKYGFSVCYATTSGSGKNSDSQSVEIKDHELYESIHDNPYLYGFIKDLFLRPSCYACPAKQGKSNSDITLADFWGVKKTFPKDYDFNGVSLVMTGTDKGEQMLNSCVIHKTIVDFDKAISNNPAWKNPSHQPKQSRRFWCLFPTRGIEIIFPIARTMHPSLIKRIMLRTKRIIQAIIHPKKL